MIKKIIIVLAMVGVAVGLYFGLKLMQENQDTRRKATGEIPIESVFTSSPSDLSNVSVGDTIVVSLSGSVTEGTGIGVLSLKFNYDNTKLHLETADVGWNSSFSDIGTSVVDSQGFAEVLLMVPISKNLLTGLINPLITFNFSIGATGNAVISLDTSFSGTSIYGSGPVNGVQTESYYKLVKDGGDTVSIGYDLGGGGGDAPANGGWSTTWSDCSCVTETKSRSCDNPVPAPGGLECLLTDGVTRGLTEEVACTPTGCDQDVDGGWSLDCSLIGTSCEKTCTNPEPLNNGADCTGDNSCAMSECSGDLGTWGDDDWLTCNKLCGGGIQTRTCPGNKYCLKTDGESIGLTETRACNEEACDDGTAKLSFDFTFAGVRSGSKCVANKKVDVTVMKGNKKELYEDVVVAASGEVNSRNETIFRVSNLDISTDFTDMTNLAVFVKGPKHLQMKFGEDGQSGYYNVAGGKIGVEAGKIFDFSEYSLMAGDVNRDGTVDVVDFVEIKKRAATHEATAEGVESQYDLDGSCQVNTIDMAILVNSLNEKYDQVY